MAGQTLSVKEIARKQWISTDSVYSDRKAALELLTALIFEIMH